MKPKSITITNAHAACARMMLYYYSLDSDQRRGCNIRDLCKNRFKLSKDTWYKYRDKYKYMAAEVTSLPRTRQIQVLIRLFEELDCTKGGFYYLNTTEVAHLCKWIHQSSIRGKSPAMIQVRRMAQCFRQLRFVNEKVGLPSRSWFDRFANDHKDEFQYRTLKNHPISRASAEDPTVIEKWFKEELLPLYQRYNITSPQQVLAMDETGFIDNAELHSSTKYMLSENVEKRIEERQPSYHYTVLHICTALGITLPPVTMFEGKRERAEMLEGAPEGTLYTFQQRGYAEASMMSEIVRHIIKYHHIPEHVPIAGELHDDRVWNDPDQALNVDTTLTRRAHTILIMDNASVHYCEEAMLLAKQAHIHICFLPPNLTHILQVSDLSCFALLKKKWYRTMNEVTYCQFDPVSVTQENFWLRLRPAWDAATCEERVIKGFEMAGQWPLNPSRPISAIVSLNAKTEHMARIVPAALDIELQQRTNMNEIDLRHRQLKAVNVELRDTKAEAERVNELNAAKIRELTEELDRLKGRLALDHGSVTATVEIEIDGVSESRTIDVAMSGVDESVTTTINASFTSTDDQPTRTMWDAAVDLHENATPKRRQAKGPRKAVNKNILYPQHRTKPGRLMTDEEAKAELAHQKLRMAGMKPVRQTVVRGDINTLDEKALVEKAKALADATERYHNRNKKKPVVKKSSVKKTTKASSTKSTTPKRKPQRKKVSATDRDAESSSSDDSSDDNSEESSEESSDDTTTSSETDTDIDETQSKKPSIRQAPRVTKSIESDSTSTRIRAVNRRRRARAVDDECDESESESQPSSKRQYMASTAPEIDESENSCSNGESCISGTITQSIHIRLTLTPKSTVIRRRQQLQNRVSGMIWTIRSHQLGQRIVLQRTKRSKSQRSINF